MSASITDDAECVARMKAAGISFRLTAHGSVAITHPLAPPPPAEMSAIAEHLGRRWTDVMNEIRRQLIQETAR